MPSADSWRPIAWIALSLLVLCGSTATAQMPEKVGGVSSIMMSISLISSR